MSGRSIFSFRRCRAVVVKEFIQMRRDRVTFAMIVGIPLIQLVIFAYAINNNPKNMAAGVLLGDHGPMGRSLVMAMRNSEYFDFVREMKSESQAKAALARGEVQFVVNIPEQFSHDLLRGDRPTILVEADATDPGTTGNAVAQLPTLLNEALRHDLKGPLDFLAATPGPIDLRVHALYNPEAITQYSIVPGLLGVILTMTMVIITSLAITRESESGTMENLLAMPTRPFEVMLGKIMPYVLVGYIQMILILATGVWVFHVPMVGSVWLLMLASLVFIAANLAMGIAISTIARNQRQAMQLSIFFYLPSILLSGFMFPFRGMPGWCQVIGNLLPLTHYLRVVRGIMLKGSGPSEVFPHQWPIALFLIVILTIAVNRYRRTLD